MSVKIEKYIYRNRVEDNFYMIKVFKEEEEIVRVKEEISKDLEKWETIKIHYNKRNLKETFLEIMEKNTLPIYDIIK